MVMWRSKPAPLPLDMMAPSRDASVGHDAYYYRRPALVYLIKALQRRRTGDCALG